MDTINGMLECYEKTVIDNKETRPEALELARCYLVEQIKQLKYKSRDSKSPSRTNSPKVDKDI